METYSIVRFFQNPDTPREVIESGLTLEQAQAYCCDPETSSSTASNDDAVALTEACGPWFDGYEKD